MHDIHNEPANIPLNQKAVDKQGHSVGVSTRVPASWIRQIDWLIKEKDLPYFHKADFLRDALFKHLRFIEDWGDKPHNSSYYRIAALVKELLEDKEQEEFEKLLEIVDKRMHVYAEIKDVDEARKYIGRVLSSVRSMPDTYWQRLYLRKLEDKYTCVTDKCNRVRIGI